MRTWSSGTRIRAVSRARSPGDGITSCAPPGPGKVSSPWPTRVRSAAIVSSASPSSNARVPSARCASLSRNRARFALQILVRPQRPRRVRPSAPHQQQAAECQCEPHPRRRIVECEPFAASAGSGARIGASGPLSLLRPHSARVLLSNTTPNRNDVRTEAAQTAATRRLVLANTWKVDNRAGGNAHGRTLNHGHGTAGSSHLGNGRARPWRLRHPAARVLRNFRWPVPGRQPIGSTGQRLWGVSRLEGADSLGSNLLNSASASTMDACGTKTPRSRAPATSSSATAKCARARTTKHGVSTLAIYPKQHFDFAGRTGTVAFDVSNDTSGSHGTWPELWIIDQPVPGPFTTGA